MTNPTADELLSRQELLKEVQGLQTRLEEAQETLDAIRSGQVDALVVLGPKGEQVYTLKGAEEPYRLMVEAMAESAVTFSQDGTILYCNAQFAKLVKTPHERILGQALQNWIAAKDRDQFGIMLAKGLQGIVRERLALQTSHETLIPAYLSIYPLPENAGRGIAAVITDLTEVTAAVEDCSRLAMIVDSSDVAIVSTSLDGVVESWNKAAERLFGYTTEESVGRPIQHLIVPPERISDITQTLNTIRAGGNVGHAETLQLRKDGTPINVYTTASPINDVMGNIAGISFIVRDITERKKAEEKLRLAASVFTHAREGIMITDADGAIIDVNAAFSDITGYSRKEVLGQNPRYFSSGLQDKKFYEDMWRDLVEQGHWHGEIWNRRKNGEAYPVMQTVSAVRDEQGKIQHYMALYTDITLLKKHEQELERRAHYDALTGLPNRELLADRLQQCMAQARRRDQRLAVVFLDLDGFKAINDNHGHEAGDQLLIALATRMKQALREGDTLARLGGDEFVAVLLDQYDTEATAPFTHLLAAAAEPVQFGETTLQVSASLGVTFYPQAEDIDADQLLRQADQAMYQAKLAGKNRYHRFDAELDRSIRSSYERQEQIRSALAAGEFVLYYQPKVNMRTGTVTGAEALIRWQHPEKGLLLPSQFLPEIENHLLAIDIGEWVIDTALAQMETWQASGLNIPVSVNICSRHLQQTDFVERLSTLLAAHPNVSPGDLQLEVLESHIMEDLIKASRVIEACRKMGVSFALDDFGTGYSSLTYLKHLPVAQLKIDQSFVRDMVDDPDDLSIVEGVIGLASAFRLLVIAEGAETVEHNTILLQLGCELAQGYGIARPMPACELPGWEAAWKPDSTWIDLSAVSRVDLPLLFANVEHRAWIIVMEKYLKGEREAPPTLDIHQCRFGQWLDTEGLARFGAQPFFEAVHLLHRQVHALAAELCNLKTQGRTQEALARLEELHDLRDALLEQLRLWQQSQH
ncbi:MAG: EAL domain-containing protein [Methylomonas sp.]